MTRKIVSHLPSLNFNPFFKWAITVFYLDFMHNFFWYLLRIAAKKNSANTIDFSERCFLQMKKLLVQYRKSLWKPIQAQHFFRQQKNCQAKVRVAFLAQTSTSPNTYFAVTEKKVLIPCIVNDKTELVKQIKILILE